MNRQVEFKVGERIRINISKEADPDTYTYGVRKLKTGMIGIVVCNATKSPQIEFAGFKGWKPFVGLDSIQKYNNYNE